MIHLVCKNSISHNAACYKTNDIPLLFYYFYIKCIHAVIVVVGII